MNTSTILNSIAIIILGLVIINLTYQMKQKTEDIWLLHQKISCLEQGRFYVGDNYCVNLPANLK